MAALAQDHLVAAVAEAERWVDAAPDDERALWLLVLSLHRAGRTSEGLDRLRAYRQRLAERDRSRGGSGPRGAAGALLAQDPALDVWPLSPRRPGAVADGPRPARPGGHAGSPDLFGREDEMTVLRERCRSAEHAAHWVVLSGTAGIGKTSLAAAVVEQAQVKQCGRAALMTRCRRGGRCRQLVRRLGEAPRCCSWRLPETDADAARFVAYERVAALLLVRGRDGGALAVVVDDVQWADDMSLSCLDLPGRRPHRRRGCWSS